MRLSKRGVFSRGVRRVAGQSPARSVLALLLGRAASVLLGLLVLAGLMRAFPPAVYGLHAMAWASIELLYLLTGAGLSTQAQREVPVWHRAAVGAAAALGASPAWALFRRLAQGVFCRAAFMGLGIGALALGAGALAAWRGEGLDALVATHWLTPAGLAPSDAGPLVLAWCAWAVAGAASRYSEELLAALSAAPLAQALAAAGQGLRLLGLGWLGLGSAEGGASPGGLATWWAVEAAVATLAVLASAIWAAWQAQRVWRGGAGGELFKPREPDAAPAGAMPAATPPALAEQRRIRRAFWAVQVLGLALGSAALRLWAGVWSGPVAAGLLSVGLTVLDSLRGLLPVTWLSPWLRTRLVQAHAAGAPVADLLPPVARLMAASAALWALAMAVLLGAVHALGLAAAGSAQAPAVLSSMSPSIPPSIQAWVQALATELQHPVLWLGLLGVGLALQVLHACLGLVTVTVGLARPHLLATAVAAAVVLGAAALAPWAGLWTWPLATLVAEGLWLAVVGWAVHQRAAPPHFLNPPSRRTRACSFT